MIKNKKMEKDNKPMTVLVVTSVLMFLLGLISGNYMKSVTHDNENKNKKYPVMVTLHGETYQSSFECDSATLNYAWKDGVRIQITDVHQIRFK